MKKMLLACTLLALSCFAVAGEAEYKYMLDTAAKIEKDRATIMTAYHVSVQEKNEKLPEAIKACATLKNEVAQMVCTLAATGNLGGGAAAQMTSLPALTLPTPPVEVAWYDKLLDRSLQVVDRIIPVWGIRENRRATVEVARINSETQIAGYAATTSQFNAMGKSNTDIAIAALSQPIVPTTQWTFNGNQGPVNAGSGTQQNNTNSNNTTTTKNCPGGTAGNTTSTTSPGTGGSSPGGTC